jgi:ubiquinone/menaquinone biosynthesis C-methylase UbiE
MGYPVEDWGAVLIQAQAEHLWMLPSGMFDTVLSHNALNHVDDFEQTISEMERLAKPNSFWSIQAEYHAPTAAEPILLSDQRVSSAFHRFRPHKIRSQVGNDRTFSLWQVGE